MFPSLTLLLVAAATLTTGARDTYPRQPVDIEHYRFAITLADTTDRIEGEATVRLRLLKADVRTVALDLAEATPARQGRGMRVSAVTGGGAALAFAHRADRLTITLARPSKEGEVVEFVVRYSGIPADGLRITQTKYGDRTFFSDDWPDKARQWLPTIDHIADKATMEMSVVAPAHYQVISNGLRVETTDLPGGTRRTVYRESVPIAPWLYTLGVARFAVQEVGEYDGKPIQTWVIAQDRDAGFHDFAVPTRDVLAFYSERVGPFSYEKLANVQANIGGGGMEAASAPMYGPASVTGTRSVRWRNVVIHEIAHQWWGNAVTENDWNDVWLSEGFATYFTLLFIEHAYGRDEFAQGLRDSRKTVLDFYARTPDYRVVHENLSDMTQVTNGMTYQKGSWVLHMLRQRMGDDRFFAGIREYYATYQDKNASTTDFRRVMERASGSELTAFFDQWLYRGGVPRVEGTWHWDAAAKQVVVELTQTQAGEPFQLPVEVGITDTAGRVRVERVELSARTARVTFAAERQPTAVTLDPNVRALIDGRLVQRPALAGEATRPPRTFDRLLLLETEGATSAGVSLGDIDRDGDPDIILAKGRHWPLQDMVLRNDGRGHFTSAPLRDEPDRTYSAALADLDGDGDLDIVSSNDRPDKKLVYLNDGTGRFRVASEFGAPDWSTRYVTVAELNGDARPDLIVANRAGSTPGGKPSFVCLNDGAGAFPSCTPIATRSATIVVAADLDRDGAVDLFVPHRDGGRNLVFWNDGKGTFTAPPVEMGPAQSSIRAATAGDLDGDGVTDLVIGDMEKGVFVYFGMSGRRFADPVALEAGRVVPGAVALADLDRDGRLDVVVGNDQLPGVILFNQGGGKALRFITAPWNDGLGSVYAVAVGDLDGDGWPDIAAARSDAPNALWFSGAGTATALRR